MPDYDNIAQAIFHHIFFLNLCCLFALQPVPNMDKLKAFDAYVSWRREEAKKSVGQ
jgi:hypothetical protein